MELLFKDLRTFLFARTRQFLEDFIDVVSGPKTFLATATVYTSENLARAFSFFVILYVLVNLLFISFVPKDMGLEKFVVFNIVYSIVFLTLALMVLQLSWLMVGARPPLRRMLLAFLYFAGIGILIQMAFLAAWIMIAAPVDQFMATVDRLNALEAEDAAAAAAFLDSHPGLLIQVISFVIAFAVYLLADLVWALIVWGAFRQLAGTGRIRSAAAFILFFALSLLLFVLSLFFIDAFLPGGATLAVL